MCFSRRKCQNPLHQFPRSKSVTSWRGQKSVVSVVSCRFPNSITTACCQLVADLLAESLTSPQQVGSFSVYGEVTGKRVLLCNGTLILTQSATVDDEPSWLGRVWRRPIVAVKTERLKRHLPTSHGTNPAGVRTSQPDPTLYPVSYKMSFTAVYCIHSHTLKHPATRTRLRYLSRDIQKSVTQQHIDT